VIHEQHKERKIVGFFQDEKDNQDKKLCILVFKNFTWIEACRYHGLGFRKAWKKGKKFYSNNPELIGDK